MNLWLEKAAPSFLYVVVYAGLTSVLRSIEKSGKYKK